MDQNEARDFEWMPDAAAAGANTKNPTGVTLETAMAELKEYKLNCSTPAVRGQEGCSDPCAEATNRVCSARREGKHGYRRLGAQEFHFDVVMLAQWLAKHQTLLPRHILWIEPTPQLRNGYSDRNREGRWRGAVVKSALDQFAPFVTFVRTFDLLEDRHFDMLDGTHWCADTASFDSLVSRVLSCAAGLLMAE